MFNYIDMVHVLNAEVRIKELEINVQVHQSSKRIMYKYHWIIWAKTNLQYIVS